MKISIIAASHRAESQSKRISKIFQLRLKKINFNLDLFSLDLAEISLPLWSPEKKEGDGIWGNTWKNISNNLNQSDGFIFIVPEYGGMATPSAKNLFLLCGDGELAHKPSLIVSVSSGNGGAYPIADLRSFSYKNSHIMWIPENIIIRNVEEYNPGNHGKAIPEWLDKRIDYTLELILAYSSNMKPLRKLINRKDFGNGM
ncbi:NAD(P)H-dependent oxidoreductase [Alphaproteobacteria bacterium]|nr:NAD(P)H-dependent oxidoreductase [Alphaproteobacteria bacterium]